MMKDIQQFISADTLNHILGDVYVHCFQTAHSQ